MLVKKLNPEWVPSENRELKVGDTIDISDPKELILRGDCVAVDSTGAEISGYELYGVMSTGEKEEFEQWLSVKKQKELQAKLVKEQADLKAEVASAKEETPVAEEKTSEEKKEVKSSKKGEK